MLRKTANKITLLLVKENIIDSELAPFYRYGTELLIMSVIDAAWILLLGIVLGKISLAVFYIFIFAFVRTKTGGYHASTFLKCFLCYTAFFLLAVELENILINYFWTIDIMLAGCSLMIIFEVLSAPVQNKKKIDDEQKKRAKADGIIRTLFCVTVMVGFTFYKPAWSYDIFLSLMISFGLMLLENVKESIDEKIISIFR